jgi:hypothetical protein
MFATTGKFKSVGNKNNDNINIVPKSVPISVEIVEKLINQESVKAHDAIKQAIEQIGIDTTKLSVDNVDMSKKIADNKQKSIDNLNKSIANSNSIYKNSNDISNNSSNISNNSSNISNNSSNISNNSSNISNNSSKILILQNAKDKKIESEIDIKITEMQNEITDLQNEIKTLKASNLALTQLTMANVSAIGLLKK